MRKLVILQIVIATFAFLSAAWLYFHLRPKVEQTQTLQSQLNVANQQNQVLKSEAKQDVPNVKQSRTLIKQGVALVHQNDFNGAVSLYDQALASYPEDPYALSLKGYALFRAGRIDESIAASRQASELDPADSLTTLDLAKSYCAAKQWENAKQTLLTADNVKLDNVKPDVAQYVKSDGEFRRVCQPILASLGSKNDGSVAIE